MIYKKKLPKRVHEVGQLQNFFKILKALRLNFYIYFSSREATKTRWDRAFWKHSNKMLHFFYNFVSQLSPLHDIYHAAETAEGHFWTKSVLFCDSNFKLLYLSEFLSPREIKNICKISNVKVLKSWKIFEVGQLHLPLFGNFFLYIKYI